MGTWPVAEFPIGVVNGKVEPSLEDSVNLRPLLPLDTPFPLPLAPVEVFLPDAGCPWGESDGGALVRERVGL